MATNTLPQNPKNELEALLGRWEARWRLKTVLLYLPRILLAAFGLGILVLLLVTFMRVMSANALIGLVAIVVTATIVAICSALGFFGKHGIEAAVKFDSLFGLQERLTTAFELIDGRIQTVDELAALQINDTLQSAQAVDAKKMIRFEWRKWEWAGAVVMGLLLFVFLGIIFLNGMRADGLSAGTEQAINAAAATAQDATELIATDSTLSDDERQSLLDSAEATLAELQNPETSPEDAFAAMSELESDLSAQAQEMREDVANSEEALTNASSALNSPNEEFNADPNQLEQQLGDWGNALNSMTPEEQQALAENLQEAADAVREENPELAENMEQAAEALQNGDTAAAQEALAAAGQSAENAASANAETSESAQEMQELAAEADQAAQDIATNEYNENAQAEGQIDPNSTIEEQLGMEEPEIAGAPGEDGGGGNGEEPTTGTQGDLVESDDPNARPADTQGNNEGQVEDGEGRGDESNSGAGSGNGEAPQSNEVQGGSPQSEISNANNTTGEGESEYEEVYAPIEENSIAGQEDIILETSDGGQPAVEGDFQENPEGQSNVPYNQVFGNYADEANRALESGYVPLGVRDVVRDYFTSIEPTGNTQP